MIFFDFTDGKFSSAFEEANAKIESGDADDIFAGFCSFMEARRLAAEIKDIITFPDERFLESLTAEMRREFILRATSLFYEYWEKSEKKRISFGEKLKLRFQAIRIAELSLGQAESEPNHKRFKQIYDQHTSKILSVAGGNKKIKEEASHLWNIGQVALAVDVLLAGIVGYEATGAKKNKENLFTQLQDYVLQYSNDLMDISKGQSDPLEAENYAIRALKVKALGYGIDKDLIKGIVPLSQEAMKQKVPSLKKELAVLGSQGHFENGKKLLTRTLWFTTEELEETCRQLNEEFIDACASYYMEKSKNTTDLTRKIIYAHNGQKLLDTYLPPGNPLQLRMTRLNTLYGELNALREKIAISLKNKQFTHVMSLFQKADAEISRFIQSTGEELVSPDFSAIITYKEEADFLLTKAKEKIQSLKKQGPYPAAWKDVVRILENCPDMTEAKEFQEEIEKNIKLSGDILIVETPNYTIRWFPKSSMTISRNAGDIPLALQSVSGLPKMIEFSFKDNVATIRDHHTSYGVYESIDPNKKVRDLTVHGAAYRKISSSMEMQIEGEGEFLFGLICRVHWQASPEFIAIRFLSPYLPKDINPLVREDIDTLWPDWRDNMEIIHVVAPEKIIIGDHPKAFFSEELEFNSSAVIIQHQHDMFRISVASGPLLIEDIPFTEAYAMKGLSYRSGKIEFNFNVEVDKGDL